MEGTRPEGHDSERAIPAARRCLPELSLAGDVSRCRRSRPGWCRVGLVASSSCRPPAAAVGERVWPSTRTRSIVPPGWREEAGADRGLQMGRRLGSRCVGQRAASSQLLTPPIRSASIVTRSLARCCRATDTGRELVKFSQTRADEPAKGAGSVLVA